MDSRFFGDMRQNNQAEIGEIIAQRRRRAGVFKNPGPLPERRSTISSMMSSDSIQVTRMRNLSGGSNGSTASGSSTGSSSQLDIQISTDTNLQLPFFMEPNAISSAVPKFRGESSSPSHRKLDRSLSDSDSDRLGNGSSSSQRSVNSSRYKTELCRPFEESGSCKYGDKCQFAHGAHELRNLARHPKYKTELCRTFHTIGFCPYGPRCHFIHGDDSKPDAPPKAISNSRDKSSMTISGSSSPSLSPSGSEDHSYFNSRSDNSPRIENRPVTNALSVNINNLNSEDVQSLEQQFSSLTVNKHNKTMLHDSGSPTFNTNGNCQEHGQEEDIFSSVSFFNPEEVLDNAPKQSSYKFSKVDNLQGFIDSSVWPNPYDLISGSGPRDPFHFSPTGSTGSDSGNISDCSGSMESLASSDQALNNNQHFAVLQSLAYSNIASAWS